MISKQLHYIEEQSKSEVEHNLCAHHCNNQNKKKGEITIFLKCLSSETVRTRKNVAQSLDDDSISLLNKNSPVCRVCQKINIVLKKKEMLIDKLTWSNSFGYCDAQHAIVKTPSNYLELQHIFAVKFPHFKVSKRFALIFSATYRAFRSFIYTYVRYIYVCGLISFCQ